MHCLEWGWMWEKTSSKVSFLKYFHKPKECSASTTTVVWGLVLRPCDLYQSSFLESAFCQKAGTLRLIRTRYIFWLWIILDKCWRILSIIKAFQACILFFIEFAFCTYWYANKLYSFLLNTSSTAREKMLVSYKTQTTWPVFLSLAINNDTSTHFYFQIFVHFWPNSVIYSQQVLHTQNYTLCV